MIDEERDFLADENEYEVAEDIDINLLDKVEDDDALDEEEQINPKDNLQKFLDEQLKKVEYYRTEKLSFIYKNKEYSGIVMGKSKDHSNRYVFKTFPDGNLKAFWIDEIDLI